MMKLFVFCAFVALSTAAEDPLFVSGVKDSSIVAAAEVFLCVLNQPGSVCASDCNTLLTCDGSEEPLLVEKCSDISLNHPYCVNKGCSSAPDPANPLCVKPPTSGVVCTSEGYFPDPKNCSQYYYCPTSSGTSQKYFCPALYVYNSPTQNCIRRRSSSDCSLINCNNIVNKFVVYPTHKAYYALCSVKPASNNTIMFKCDNVVNYEFNVAIRSCEFVCPSEGKFKNEDCKKYYQCYRNIQGRFVHYIENCPSTTYFDSITRQCIKGSCP